ncbi:MAG: hypothetical protein AVDCRST_MAG65-1865, partial [uncultured Solirubrobacteraceae bacterium]
DAPLGPAGPRGLLRRDRRRALRLAPCLRGGHGAQAGLVARADGGRRRRAGGCGSHRGGRKWTHDTGSDRHRRRLCRGTGSDRRLSRDQGHDLAYVPRGRRVPGGRTGRSRPCRALSRPQPAGARRPAL